MRKINVSAVKSAVTELCLRANFELRPDMVRALRRAYARETNCRSRDIIASIIENARLAKAERIALCQDTGMVLVVIEIGRDVRLVGGDIKKAVNDGVATAYRQGCLRRSVVADPLQRTNTRTNTPAIIIFDIVPGNRVHITVAPKGFGSENKSAIHMFKPTVPIADIKAFILKTVERAGPDACPPFVIGIGIGGSFDEAPRLAKKALVRPVDQHHHARHIARLEKELVHDINALGIGPMGLGGKTTVLGVNIETFPTHIAGLPVAVSMSCHATRSAEKVL